MFSVIVEAHSPAVQPFVSLALAWREFALCFGVGFSSGELLRLSK